MSIAEIERFAADLKSNEALRADAARAPSDASHASTVELVVTFAASKGYAFTVNDVEEYAKARKLADGELDRVAGGVREVEPVAIPVGPPKSDGGGFMGIPGAILGIFGISI
jgi:predicted ribosomally synthesized peptide with nif11-like leader